jgi:tripartite-type tricarboxylate transporter receptor subunit TctC
MSASKIIAAACALGCFASEAHAAATDGSYPVKPIRLVVPFAPGGPNDILARFVAQKLTAQWGQTIVVENRGGAGGTVGMEQLSKLPPDGYSLGVGASSNLAVAPGLYARLGYDSSRDFTPIINLASVPYALALNPTVPARNVRDLMRIVAGKRGGLNYGSSGNGSMSQLAAEMFKYMAKVDIVHVPYKGTAPALTDVVAGQIDMMFADLAIVMGHANVGKLRAIGVTSQKRSGAAPQLQTIGESGLPGYEMTAWFCVVGPAGMPKDIVARVNAAIAASLKSTEVQERLVPLGYEPIGGSPEALAATIKSDTERFGRIIKAAGMKADL